MHDINKGLTTEGGRFIIHDSCGFQAGNDKDIQDLKTFIKARTSVADVSERLHAIWFAPPKSFENECITDARTSRYCIETRRNRIHEDVDTQFFKVLRAADSNVPVVLVCTRVDLFENDIEFETKKSYMKEHQLTKRSIKELHNREIGILTDRTVQEYKDRLSNEFKAMCKTLCGPAFVDKGKLSLGSRSSF